MDVQVSKLILFEKKFALGVKNKSLFMIFFKLIISKSLKNLLWTSLGTKNFFSNIQNFYLVIENLFKNYKYI